MPVAPYARSERDALEIIMNRRHILQTGALSFVLSFSHAAAGQDSASARAQATCGLERYQLAGAVFTLSNEVAGNRVVAFVRGRDGALHDGGSYATGGTGTGASLQSQNALVLSDSQPTELKYPDLVGELAPFASAIAVY
jgi:hypothetical protein